MEVWSIFACIIKCILGNKCIFPCSFGNKPFSYNSIVKKTPGFGLATMKLKCKDKALLYISCCFRMEPGGGGRGANVECDVRHAPDASDRLASFSREGGESWALPQSNWYVHCCCRQSTFRFLRQTL